MKNYIVRVSAHADVEVAAQNEEEAVEIAEDEWYEALQFSGTHYVQDVYEKG
mgnify:CR=1 FL=1